MHSRIASMRPLETVSGTVTIRWTETSLVDSYIYGVSQDALTALLASNPTCGLPRADIKHLRCLPWAGSKKAVELTIWYIYVAGAKQVEIIAISDPSDPVSDRAKNADDASTISKRIVSKIRDSYVVYRMIKEIIDHWPL